MPYEFIYNLRIAASETLHVLLENRSWRILSRPPGNILGLAILVHVSASISVMLAPTHRIFPCQKSCYTAIKVCTSKMSSSTGSWPLAGHRTGPYLKFCSQNLRSYLASCILVDTSHSLNNKQMLLKNLSLMVTKLQNTWLIRRVGHIEWIIQVLVVECEPPCCYDIPALMRWQSIIFLKHTRCPSCQQCCKIWNYNKFQF